MKLRQILGMVIILVTKASIIATITIPVGTGELLDKITILEIKQERVHDPVKLKNIELEHRVLVDALDQNLTSSVRGNLELLAKQLREVNEKLWDIEDSIREKEAKKEFDGEFITIARSVYTNNRTRHELKHMINETSKSDIIEEKQYTDF